MIQYAITNNLDLANYLKFCPPSVSVVSKEVQETVTDSILLNWRQLLKNTVRNVAAKCSKAGWDEEDALPVSLISINAAGHFIDLLPECIETPFITAENTGDISFDWDLGKNMTFTVIVSRDYAIYAGIFGEARQRGRVRIYDEMPSPINDILVRYFKK